MISRQGNVVSNSSAREDLVTFDPVEPLCPAESDVTLRYTLGTRVAANPLDWVGIFKSGCRDTDNPLTCQWAPVAESDGVPARERHLVFPAKFIQPLTDQPESCQFLYVSGSGHILGASQPFKVMDTGDMVGAQTSCPVIESRDGHSANQDANSYVNISPEFLSSDDEWELASREELCKTNSTTSDLSDIEILSTSPSKEAVKMQVSATCDEGADDVFLLEKVKPGSLLVGHTAPQCFDNQRIAAVPKLQSTSQYSRIVGVCESEQEIVEVKRKLKKRIKRCQEEEENGLAKCINVKESTKVKKLKQSTIASRKIDKQTNKSKKMLNAPASVIRIVQVNSECSSDNEEYSSGVQNCNVRKRKRKSNTGKNKCHLSEQDNIAVSSDSYPEIQQANIKKAKRKRIRPKMEESVTPLCNRLALGQKNISDCKNYEVVDNLNKIIDIDQLACRTKPEMESVNSKRTGQRLEMDCERLNYVDENKIQEVFPRILEDVASPAKTKVSSKKKKKVDDNLKEKDTACCLKNVISPDKMSCRKEMDAKTKFEMISLSPNNMKTQNNTMINQKLVRDSDENKKQQVIRLGMEELQSEKRIMAQLRNVEEIRNVSIIPLCNKRTKYPEKLTANSKLASDDRLRINNSTFKMQNVFFGEEISFKKFNNIDESERHKIAESNLHTIEDSKKQHPTNNSEDDYERKRDEVSVCNLKDVELTKKIQTNSKLARVSAIDCFQGDTITEIKCVPPRKKLKANPKTSNNCDKKLQVTAALNEQRMTENVDTTKHKPVSQIRNSQIGEIDCRMFKTSDVECQHHCDGEIGENRPELSDGFMWDISPKETTEPVISDCCPEKVRKKCPRKMKLRTRKEASIKRQADMFGEEMAAVLSGRNQTEETRQNSIQSIAVREDTERPSLNHTVPPESSSQNREMATIALQLDGNSAMCVEYGASCKEKPTCGVTDEGSCLIDWGDLRSGGSRADRTEPSGHQVRKEKSSTSKVRGSQSKFKAKYKCQGRTSSRMQYFRRGEINKWRKLCRLLILNKRRFKVAPGIAASDVDGRFVESQNTEGSKECTLLEVSTRADLCPQVPDLTKSVISGPATVASVDAKCRQTYASVVKGTNQDLSISDEKEQINCIVGNAYKEWFATTHHSTECPKKDTGLAELEEKSKLLCYNCLSNTEVSSLQNTYKLPGLELENNPNILNAGKEFSWDFPTGNSGNLSVSRNFVTRADSEVETVCSCSNKSGHAFIVSDDISGVKMAEDTSVKMAEETSIKMAEETSIKMAEETSIKMAEETSIKMAEETKETQCAEGKLAGVLRDAEDIPIVAPDDLQADIRTEKDDVILDWPLPASFTRVSLLKSNSKCGHGIPLQTERTADNQGILASCMKAGVIPSTWISDQPLTDNTCPDTPIDVGMSSEIELPSSQAGQTYSQAGPPEVAETVVSKEAAGRGPPPQTSGDSKTDDIQLVWPLPGFNTFSSKFGCGTAPGDQANIQQINNHKLFQRDDSHSWSVPRISLDVPSFPAPVQSQLSIPRIRGPPNNSYIKAAPSPCPKKHKNGLDQTEARLNGENTDLRQRVDALEKQLEDLNYILANQQQTLVHGGGNSDDVAVSGSSRSGKFKSVKHKRVPIAKSKGSAMGGLARSSVETVNVKPKVRIHKTRLADLENQLNIFKESLMNATSQPVKINVKCKKLRVKISGQKGGTNTGQATESPITVAVTEEEDDAHESHSGMDNRDLVQETLPTVDDLEEESYSEIKNGVRRCHHQCPSGERRKWVVDKSASEEEYQDWAPVINSPVQTGTPAMGYHRLVYDELANGEYRGFHQASTTRTEYRKVIPEDLSNTEDYLPLIPQRVDDRHLPRRAFSDVRNSDLVSDPNDNIFSLEKRPDLILETSSNLDNFDHARQTSSNFRSHDSVTEIPSRVGVSCEVRRTCSRPWEFGHIRENHSSVEECHLADSRSRSTGETRATKENVEKSAALPSTSGDQPRESDHHGIVRPQLNGNGHQVSLVGMGDAPSLMSTSQDSLGFPHTHPKHDCPDGSFALCSGNAYAPTCKVNSTYANRCSAHPVVTPHKLRNLKMYTSLSGDNHYCTESLWNDRHRDGEYVSIPPPYSPSHSPCSYLTSLEKHSEYLNSPEMCTSEIHPVNSSIDRRVRQVCQHSHTSFTPELPYMSTSKSCYDQTQTPHPRQWIGPHHGHHKLRSQNDNSDLNGDSPRKESTPWRSTTKMSFPKPCCWHLAQSAGNCLHDDKQFSEKSADNPISSNTCYLSEKHQCLCHTSENKHTQHVKDSEPHFSPMHFKSQGKYEKIFSGRMARLSSRDTDTGSADFDVNSRPSFLTFSPKTTVDIATHSEDFNVINYPKDKPKCPSSSRHSEQRTFYMPYYNSESQSSDPVDCSNHLRVHERHQFRSKKHNHSEKQIDKTLDHEVNLPHLHCYNLLHHKLRQISSLDDTNSACPYQAWNDPDAVQCNRCCVSQMPCAKQHSSSQQQQHCSHPNSLLYPQYHPYLHNDAHGIMWDNICMNNTCLSPTSLVDNFEERQLHYTSHMHQADEKADQLNSTAVTEYLPSHNSCRNCFCFTDDCTHRRQIEGCQSCLQHITR